MADPQSPGTPVSDDSFRSKTWSASLNGEFLLHSTIIGGIGSSAIGGDRGAIGPSLVCRADRVGDQYAIVATNSAFSHSLGDQVEQRAARASFAESVLALCEALPSDSFDPSELGLVDFLRMARALSNDKQVSFVQDPSLSYIRRVRRFGSVLTIEAVLSFVPVRPDPVLLEVTGHSPQPEPSNLGYPAPTDTVSVVQQVAIRALPGPGYRPLPFSVAAGAMPGCVTHQFESIAVRDARTPLATRFRVPPGDPARLIFYLDPATPEPFRSAILEGGSWWSEAFVAAGFAASYQVLELPDGVDLLDPRINIVLWVHRVDRGWSYGMTQLDPRTGEILRGIVRLGSQRIEQVRMLCESVLAPYASGRAEEVADVLIRRVRQLAAHEIGHAIGVAHNFASHHHSKTSVMDYPAPSFSVESSGSISTSESYSTGLGPWDYRAVGFLYGDQVQRTECGQSLEYVHDADSRLDDAADSRGATWVFGSDEIEALGKILSVRKVAMAGFSPGVAPPGSDGSEIERRFVLLYLLHRHQTIAVAKLIGGSYRCYAETDGRRFDGRLQLVPADRQRAALASLKTLISPEFITIPEDILSLLVGPGGGLSTLPGSFVDEGSNTFDPVAAMSAATDLVAAAILAPGRLNRVLQQDRSGTGLRLGEIVDATVGFAIEALNVTDNDVASEVLGWAILLRAEQTARSNELHEHARVALAEAIEALDPGGRRSVSARIEKILIALQSYRGPLPMLPLGAPL